MYNINNNYHYIYKVLWYLKKKMNTNTIFIELITPVLTCNFMSIWPAVKRIYCEIYKHAFYF